jgi:hypothetical protein
MVPPKSRAGQTELFSNVVGMINAAHETTTNLIGNTILDLLRNPDQWQALVADPSPRAVEGLRGESVKSSPAARRTVEVAGSRSSISPWARPRQSRRNFFQSSVLTFGGPARGLRRQRFASGGFGTLEPNRVGDVAGGG